MSRIYPRFLLFIVVIALIAVHVSAQSMKPVANHFSSVINDMENQLKKDMAADRVEGSISIAIIHKDQIIWSGALGYADRENKINADTSTIYRIASLTKSFTATAMMQLVEKGILKLDDPVEVYLPEIKKLKGYSEDNKITFFQLATHRSGLEREPRLENEPPGGENWEEKVLTCIPATYITTAPGKKYRYSNMGYAILGLALERAAKKPYMDLITQNIFTTLHMQNSFFVPPPNDRERLAKGMVIDSSGKVKQLSPSSTPGHGLPAGGIYSTPNDLAKFLMANMGFDPVCSEQDRAQIQKGISPPLSFLQLFGVRLLTPFLGGENKKIARLALHSKYGMGLSEYSRRHLDIIEHSGQVNGFSSQFAFDKNSQYGIVLFRNYTAGKTNLELFSIELLAKLSRLDK